MYTLPLLWDVIKRVMQTHDYTSETFSFQFLSFDTDWRDIFLTFVGASVLLLAP